VKLSEAAKDAVLRIKALRKLPVNPSTTRAESRILGTLTLAEVSDVALILSQDEEAKTGRAQ
jgi:hypothetical protein